MNIEDQINAQRLKEEAGRKAILAPTLQDMAKAIKEDIIKGKPAFMGEIREWGGVKYKKVSGGWIPVRKEDQQKMANDVASDGTKSDDEKPAAAGGGEDLSEHAKGASESALINATKVSKDPKVREAAHRELQRRKSEEAQETFKAPEEGGEKKEDLEDLDTPIANQLKGAKKELEEKNSKGVTERQRVNEHLKDEARAAKNEPKEKQDLQKEITVDNYKKYFDDSELDGDYDKESALNMFVRSYTSNEKKIEKFVNQLSEQLKAQGEDGKRKISPDQKLTEQTEKLLMEIYANRSKMPKIKFDSILQAIDSTEEGKPDFKKISQLLSDIQTNYPKGPIKSEALSDLIDAMSGKVGKDSRSNETVSKLSELLAGKSEQAFVDAYKAASKEEQKQFFDHAYQMASVGGDPAWMKFFKTKEKIDAAEAQRQSAAPKTPKEAFKTTLKTHEGNVTVEGRPASKNEDKSKNIKKSVPDWVKYEAIQQWTEGKADEDIIKNVVETIGQGGALDKNKLTITHQDRSDPKRFIRSMNRIASDIVKSIDMSSLEDIDEKQIESVMWGLIMSTNGMKPLKSLVKK